MISSPRRFLKAPSPLPGFGVTMGLTITYLSLVVLLPLACLGARAADAGWSGILKAVTSERAIAAFGVSLGTALIAALINVVFGLIVAWTLVRYRFPGRGVIDSLVDLPFALPTAVAGIALTTLLVPQGWIGSLLEPLGIKVAFTPLGIIVALVFIGLPFVVRTVEPVLLDIEREHEEAAAMLGADRGQIFFRVILPTIAPALATGFALALARGIGEYGSVIFIAGNIPGVSEIVPLLIVIRLEQYDYEGAAAIATAMLIVSFALLLMINTLQRWSRRDRASR